MTNQQAPAKRICNTCQGTGIVKGLPNWGSGGTREEKCWNCHEAPQQPAPSAAAEPDMFWNYDDPECFGHDIEDVISEYAPGDIVKIDCAKRMPTIQVRVVANGDELTYEIIGAPQPSPTPQADSVLEDAARYRWLRNPTTDVALVLDKRTGYVPVDERVPSVGGYYTYEYRSGDELDAAIDAARKQGANHD